jgi:glycosyltransferase involved in cell wall biosynthesis
MKPLLLNTLDIEGGAARAVYRLHEGLQKINVSSSMLVQRKASDDSTVFGPTNKVESFMNSMQPKLDGIPKKLYRNIDKKPWHAAWAPSSIHKQIQELNPDIVHLHWVCGGFLPIESISKIDKPMVWTLHDMWPFTGGCHYSGECTKYQRQCGACEQLGSNKTNDLSRKVWNRKFKALQNQNIKIVTPSKWLADTAKSSSLFNRLSVEVIPNGLDMNVYKPIDKKHARSILNLPLDKKLVLFGAMSSTSDERKGFQYLKPALESFSQMDESNDTELIVFGASTPKDPPNLGLKTTYVGRVYDDITLALYYSAADVMCVPSIQEAFGQTASEALACGTPVVAFGATGLLDIVDHKVNGYLVKPFDPIDFSEGIRWALSIDENMKKAAVQKVESKFKLETVAKQYLQLYEELI